jgi:hypothetical protein
MKSDTEQLIKSFDQYTQRTNGGQYAIAAAIAYLADAILQSKLDKDIGCAWRPGSGGVHER